MKRAPTTRSCWCRTTTSRCCRAWCASACRRATIITFWHIPWPNPEAFGICPWREEVLEGMLGSSILGFHTQFHCNNFFDTVDRFLEARVDRETFTISYGGQPTEVRRYPISIEWPPNALAVQAPVPECRKRVRESLGLSPDVQLGVGVDRLDYTKGILERFAAIERLLELEPRWIGKFSFLQVAAPSRVVDRRVPEPRHACARSVGGAHQRALRQAGLPADRAARSSTTTRRRSTRCTAPPTCATSRACTTA